MLSEPIDTRQFMDVVRGPLTSGDAAALAHAVKARWTARQVCRLLRHEDADVRRVAAVTIGMVGERSLAPCLARSLHDADPMVNEMAEHGLWSIWFRCGSSEASKPFSEGVQHLSDERYEPAVHCFNAATALDPQFAEAFNQCAIAHFFLGQWRPAVADCRRALALMPIHFGAMAGMGHCHTQLGEMEQALRCYRAAVRINPRLTAVAAAIPRLEAMLADERDSSGIYDAAQIR